MRNIKEYEVFEQLTAVGFRLAAKKDLGYIDLKKYEKLDNEAEIVKKMLSKLYSKVSSHKQ